MASRGAQRGIYKLAPDGPFLMGATREIHLLNFFQPLLLTSMDINGIAGAILSSKGLTFFTFATTFIVTSIIWTVLKQIFFKNPNEPPVVFHWVPVIGSTVTYGIDPYKFYFDCQAKVSLSSSDE